MLLWGPLFHLTGNYVQVLSLVPEMLTSMRLMAGTLGNLSRTFTHERSEERRA